LRVLILGGGVFSAHQAGALDAIGGKIALKAPRSRLFGAIGIDYFDGIAIGLLGLCAFVIGLLSIALTVDCPGDGPSHAILAYRWSQHPAIITSGIWLPGFDYLAGLCLMAVPDPLVVPRLYNLVITTLTVPVFYALVRKLYGKQEALLAALALVALPLRIGLGASSLTEGSFLLFVLIGLLFLMIAVEQEDIGRIALLVSLSALLLAEMTRYEIWLLVPLLVCYLYARSGNLAATVIAAIVLSVFPLAWSLGNYFSMRDFFPGFTILSHAPEGANPVGFRTALGTLYWMVGRQIGRLLAIGASAGLIIESYKCVRGRLSAHRTCYAILVVVVSALSFRGALALGPGLVARYLLLAFALALPLAAVAFVDLLGRRRYTVAFGAIAIAASFAPVYRRLYPLSDLHTPVCVTRYRPTEIIELAKWLRSSPYKSEAIVMTKMKWRSSYLPIYAPEYDSRHVIISSWTSDDAISDFIKAQRPSLLIAGPEDTDGLLRLDRIIGHPIDGLIQHPVYANGKIIVIDISSLIPH
jgi:hypothetical protein